MGKVSILEPIREDVIPTRFLDGTLALPTKPMPADASSISGSLTSSYTTAPRPILHLQPGTQATVAPAQHSKQNAWGWKPPE